MVHLTWNVPINVIGPILFLCSINDLAVMTRNLGNCISLYADDAVIHCSNYAICSVKSRLERALIAVNEWCK